eukprot:759307-Hanusia_phi.AAC.4
MGWVLFRWNVGVVAGDCRESVGDCLATCRTAAATVWSGCIRMGSSWPFQTDPLHAVHPKLGKSTLNKIIYGHSLDIGTGAGRYRGGLVESLAFGNSNNHGREFRHYASHQNDMSGGLLA